MSRASTAHRFMPPMMVMVVVMMPTMFLLPKSKPSRSVVEVQKGDDNSQERSKGEAHNESDLDVVIRRWVIRELSPYKSGIWIRIWANMTEGLREWMRNGWGSMVSGSLQMRQGYRDIHQISQVGLE
ncbi:uncharacterized protein FFB20_09239 [Fusarium fujikuroi]|uniref:Transmembrane protein n=1 Tax=Fusarium proliferatum (strain ET1) TaxID=1227346 RepID=A0A1L7W327_FUSPR|nr:uncharacterized protein FPRO_08266 [Fusarium proliferatum ET1]SCN79529.1 uncharacterized protein FFC1_03253 [Fusarium fujikuroi]CZR46892.1 uncharacterized protein FPRO_08266 [Fusarium proliferatum ET1]SCN92541.1 uncharacterized protein FFB20_09239 [Fusarium fujikuroi]SCO04318.1 uncharacterized protein FFE2_10586 [Fusarium fujikuroi]SCO32141.1 uncharacterized protein FFNC_02710 [Fusarium fujikuroi]